MSDHLLAVHIGPVQEFIAAARRCQDLWYGSHLLGTLATHAADHTDKTLGTSPRMLACSVHTV